MKITCIETFEKGMPTADGGMFKMTYGQSFIGEVTVHGVIVTISGKNRMLKRDVLTDLEALGVIRISENKVSE